MKYPFTETCPNPFVNKENDANLVFCSKPEYIQLLEAVGTDVVELTGDHFRDWGSEAMITTLECMRNADGSIMAVGEILMMVFSRPHFNHNGNKIAFFGCNAKPVGYATASDTNHRSCSLRYGGHGGTGKKCCLTGVPADFYISTYGVLFIIKLARHCRWIFIPLQMLGQ